MSISLELKEFEPFWIVARLDGRCMPKVRHTTRKSAVQEATRLAHQNYGTEFFVLRVLDSFQTPPPADIHHRIWGQ